MRLLFWAAFAAFAIDQVSKYLVIHVMKLSAYNPIDVLPPILNFRYGENRGINFGLFGGDGDLGPWLLIGLASLICVGVLFWASRTALPKVGNISAGMLVGGAIGNILDRLLYGYVLDFLNMSCCTIRNPFVFNLADVFIFAGAAGLIFFAGDDKQPPKSSKAKKAG